MGLRLDDRSAPRGFLSRWAHALGFGSARPGPEGHSYRDARDALRRIGNQGQVRNVPHGRSLR